MAINLRVEFGDIDIYLFDQILRGRVAPGMRILDAGCGGGRNLVYLLRAAGYDVCGADHDPAAVGAVQALAASVTGRNAGADFRVEPVEAMSFPDAHTDVVLASAVLHFARDAAHFDAMLRGAWRVLRRDGMFFARLASTIGMPPDLPSLGEGRYLLPDGSERYLVDAPTLIQWTRQLGGVLMDPIKTTVVHEQRSMTTWVVRKG